MTQPTAVRSDDLINSFGVATHINYTDGQYLNVTKDISALQYLGLDHVRDAAPNPNYDYTGQVHLGAAADAGIKFTFVANDPNPALVVQRIHDFVVAHPGSVVGIEGPNEVNNWPVTYNGQSGTAGAQAYQQALFNAVNNDPLLKNIPVLGFTDYPVHASASDWNNIHPYPKNGDQPYNDIAGGASAQAAVDPGKPFAITELGYHTSLTADTAGGWEGVNEATQAKLLLNAMMDAALLGSRSTSIYQLLDAYADPQGSDQEKHFGLFRLDGTSKPAADAIHNLTSIMADAGGNASSFSASTLNYSISGLPSTGHSYLTQKSDGSFQIIAWGEPDIWNEVTDTPISAASTPVNVNLGQTFSTVQVFDPLQGTNATQTLHNVSSVSIGLTDHPLIIQTSTDKSTSIGTGSDQLVLRISQDAYQGDAQYTVSVDGKQIGGVLTAHASHAAGQSDTVTVNGDWASGGHTVAVNFLNDAWGGSASLDRNLYVDSATYGSAAVADAHLSLAGQGAQNFTFVDTAASAPTSTSIGTGSDKLLLRISQDAYQGDAQYTVSVDGKQIGGVLTAHASHAAGQSDTVTVNGDWASGGHTVAVNFLNDAWGGSASLDRNLYVDSATYGSAAVADAHLILGGQGAQNFTFVDTAASAPTSTSIGTGSDKLLLRISQDAYQGDAQYTVSVDGKQIGGVLTAHASHAAGQSDTVTVNGDWASGGHTVAVNFLNDAWGGSASLDRNLYVDSATYGGAAVADAHLILGGQGAQNFTFVDTAASAPTSTSIGTGSDKLLLRISQDAYQGDAQYTVSVDGKQIGGVLTAHASHAAGQSDTVTVNGDWASGGHTVAVNFLNDAWGGSASLDRNLYVDSATYGSAAVADAHLSLAGQGAQNFTFFH